MNTCYKHFYFFVTGFKLVDPKELEPLVRIDQNVLLACLLCTCDEFVMLLYVEGDVRQDLQIACHLRDVLVLLR